MVVLGTRLLPRLLKQVLQWGSRELFLVTVVATGVGLGYAAHLAGLSFALGAFVAGVILSESEFSHQALSDIVPLRDVFGLLFFVTVGMLFDPAYVVEHIYEIGLVTLAIVLGKAIILGGLTRAFGYRNMAPWIVGLGLAQIGEFSFVLARSGFNSGGISKAAYDLVLTCTILTMALSPVVSSASVPLAQRWRKWRKTPELARPILIPKEGLEDHVVVAGYGRSGRAVARALRSFEIPLLVVESDYSLYGDASAAQIPTVWGDVSREEVLRACSIEKARILVLTIPDRIIVRMCMEQARSIHPGLFVIARAVREVHVAELRKLGVDGVVQPEFEGGIEMVRQALVQYREESDVLQLLTALRDDLRRGSL
jgi:CPA2 family monovalent cation:H+ antiporter-2